MATEALTDSVPSAASSGRWMSLMRNAFGAITWRHVGATALLGLLMSVIFLTVSHAIGVFLFQNWSVRASSLVQNSIIFQGGAFIFLACILVADEATRRGAARVRTYVVAVLLASFLFAAFDTFFRYIVFDQYGTFKSWWKAIHPLSQFMWFLVVGGFTTFVYADLRRNRESAARLQAATLRRSQTARDALQTRLQAMQARVEPQFLFDTLDRIGEIYDRDPVKGQQTIDDLIIYLRTAMPQMHDSGSTVAREIELVRTYTAVVAACSSDRVRLTIESNEDWTRTAFPPMLLLPLVEHAIAAGRVTHPEDGALTLRALRDNGKLRIAVGHGGTAFADDRGSEAIERIREHLQTLFDTKATLDRRTTADRGTEVVLEIPG